MATISELNNLISIARTDISICKDIIGVVNSLEENITACVSKLESASSKISNGLIVNGKPADGGAIQEIATSIKQQMLGITNIVGSVQSTISELEENIINWKRQKEIIEANLAKKSAAKGLFSGIFGANRNNK